MYKKQNETSLWWAWLLWSQRLSVVVDMSLQGLSAFVEPQTCK